MPQRSTYHQHARPLPEPLQQRPSAFSKHEKQVNEVSARIQELLNDVDSASDKAPLEAAPPDGEGSGGSEASCDSDTVDYGRRPTGDGPRLAQQRLRTLLSRLNTDKRDVVLAEVREWLHDRVSFARQDLSQLGCLDVECAEDGSETLQAAKATEEDLQRHGRDMIGALREFCAALANMETAKRESRQRLSSKTGVRVYRPKRRSTSGQGQGHAPMTDEELEVAIQELREKLHQAEDQACEELRKVQEAERVRMLPSEEEDSADLGPGDIYSEQEKVLLYLRESIRENEIRAKMIREVNDNLHGKVMMGDHGEFIPLSQEALRVARGLQEEVSNAILPELLADREARHGEDLRVENEERLSKLTAECQSLDQRIRTLGALVTQLHNDETLEEDLQAQLSAIDAGQLPQGTLLQSCLSALEEGEDLLDEPSEEHVEVVELDGEQEQQQSNLGRRQVADQLVSAELDMRAHVQESSRLHQKLLETSSCIRAMQEELRAMEEEDAAVLSLLDLIEEHRILFLGAMAVAQYSPALEQRPQRPKPLPLHNLEGGEGDGRPDGRPPGKQDARSALTMLAMGGKSGVEDRSKDSAGSKLVAVARAVTRMARNPAPGQRVGGAGAAMEESRWTAGFLADENSDYPPEALAEQLGAVKAMVEKERGLERDCHELEAALDRKMAELSELSSLPHSGVSGETTGLLNESMKAGQETIEGFRRSLRTLTEVAVTAPGPSALSLDLQERREAVNEAQAIAQEEGEQSGSVDCAHAAVLQAQRLCLDTAGLLERLKREGEEVQARRHTQLVRRITAAREPQKQRDQQEAARESRALRQHTRTLAAMRSEIAVAVAVRAAHFECRSSFDA